MDWHCDADSGARCVRWDDARCTWAKPRAVGQSGRLGFIVHANNASGAPTLAFCCAASEADIPAHGFGGAE